LRGQLDLKRLNYSFVDEQAIKYHAFESEDPVALLTNVQYFFEFCRQIRKIDFKTISCIAIR
jgi:hypothetical protein